MSSASVPGSQLSSPTGASSGAADLRADDASMGSDGLTAKEREQLNMQSSAFDALERDFREVRGRESGWAGQGG